MNWKEIAKFLENAYSDTGMASSGRLLSTILAIPASGVLIAVSGHMLGISDTKLLGIWLASFPVIVISLVIFYMAPYVVTKGSASLKDLLDFLKGKKDE